jgi:hypothetical protein
MGATPPADCGNGRYIRPRVAAFGPARAVLRPSPFTLSSRDLV